MTLNNSPFYHTSFVQIFRIIFLSSISLYSKGMSNQRAIKEQTIYSTKQYLELIKNIKKKSQALDIKKLKKQLPLFVNLMGSEDVYIFEDKSLHVSNLVKDQLSFFMCDPDNYNQVALQISKEHLRTLLPYLQLVRAYNQSFHNNEVSNGRTKNHLNNLREMFKKNSLTRQYHLLNLVDYLNIPLILTMGKKVISRKILNLASDFFLKPKFATNSELLNPALRRDVTFQMLRTSSDQDILSLILSKTISEERKGIINLVKICNTSRGLIYFGKKNLEKTPLHSTRKIWKATHEFDHLTKKLITHSEKFLIFTSDEYLHIFSTSHTLKELKTIRVPNSKNCTLDPSGSKILVTTPDKNYIYHLITEAKTIFPPFPVSTVHWSKDKKYIIAGDFKGNLFVWDINLELIKKFHCNKNARIKKITSHPKGKFFAYYIDGSDSVHISTTHEDNNLHKLSFLAPYVPIYKLHDFEFHPSLPLLACLKNHWPNFIVYNMKTGKCLHKRNFSSNFTSLSWSLDGQKIILGGDNIIKIIPILDQIKIINTCQNLSFEQALLLRHIYLSYERANGEKELFLTINEEKNNHLLKHFETLPNNLRKILIKHTLVNYSPPKEA